ncbi:MAG: hypothetical protein AAF389_03605 [Gemmatimonadota bacterium]
MKMQKKVGQLLAAGMAVFALSLLAFQPVPASAYFSSCEAPAENDWCCACSAGEFCRTVEHQGIQSCNATTCGTAECESLA